MTNQNKNKRRNDWNHLNHKDSLPPKGERDLVCISQKMKTQIQMCLPINIVLIKSADLRKNFGKKGKKIVLSNLE